jgi:peptide/nickel transport system permease protein
VGQLLVLLFGILTLLFFLARLSGDPALVLAGENATPGDVERVRHFYGLDRPLGIQYAIFLSRAVRFDFGDSMVHQTDALALVLSRLPATLELAACSMLLNLTVAILLGTWLGARSDAAGRRAGTLGVLAIQGLPAFVVALLLIQLFAVEFRLLPSIGNEGPLSIVLPATTLAWFFFPRLVRLVATNVEFSMRQTYVRTARASGATSREVVWRHVLPNSLLGGVAFLGVQFAFLLSGSLVIESVFGWPGVGQLMVQSVRLVDFPVVQAAVFMVAIMVFAANTATDLVLPLIDPRLRGRRG